MPSYKFKVGDIVAVRQTISRFVPGGVFEVVFARSVGARLSALRRFRMSPGLKRTQALRVPNLGMTVVV